MTLKTDHFVIGFCLLVFFFSFFSFVHKTLETTEANFSDCESMTCIVQMLEKFRFGRIHFAATTTSKRFD
jgi:hypothetical protein